ncbi:hypothetical protein SUGI_0934070 [Cryptomeria japonica]|nr:hypothetical protein SUGI_0934070 [Cryptomeria japonica]
MFVSERWLGSPYATKPEAEKVVIAIFDTNFAKIVEEIINVSEPLVRVLRIVDGDHNSMGYLYEAMDKAKEAIQHLADAEVRIGLDTCIRRLVDDEILRDLILDELQSYKKALGELFSSPDCKRRRATLRPDLWWEDYGATTPNLQKLAIRILSQPCSASGSEWVASPDDVDNDLDPFLTNEQLSELERAGEEWDAEVAAREEEQEVDHAAKAPVSVEDVATTSAPPTQWPQFVLSFSRRRNL